MPSVICIVGKSDSGKTTLIEKLIPELKQRGFRVGTIKHSAHGFEIDQKGKDSWRHRQAGADTVAVLAPGQIAFTKRTDQSTLEDILGFFEDMDVIITEGFKRSNQAKIEIFRKGVHDHPLEGSNNNLVAYVTDAPLDTDLPLFDLDDIRALADFIESRLPR